ncbi:MAG: DNA repair protein RecO [Flavobacteriales bacterium]
MNQQTKGIVLKQLKYSESSIIIRVYTLDFGVQSYLVRGVRKKKSKNHSTLFQPLSLIDLTSFTYKNNDLNLFQEGKNFHLFKNLYSDPVKINISFFLSELLASVLKEEIPDLDLFYYITESLQILDGEEQNYANFHLWFMLHLTQFLGFYPNTDQFNAPYFNLMEGNFTFVKSVYTCSEEDSIFIKKFLKLTINQSLALKFNKQNRQNILDILIKYYNLQNHDISNLKSLKILKEIFDIL